MSDYKKIIDELNARYVYVYDSEQYGVAEVWKDLSQISRYKRVKGDCEDYAIYLWRKIKGCEIWYCRAWGGGHAVVKLPNGYWIDCNYRKPMISPPAAWDMSVGYPIPELQILQRIEDGSVFIEKPRSFSFLAVRSKISDIIYRIKVNIKELFT